MISIAAFPEKGEPYTECFYEALRRKGIEIRDGDFSGRWILKNGKNFDYFHFHWPSFFYKHRNGTIKTTRRFVRFLMLLILIKLCGSKIIWTAHNLYPHDKSNSLFFDKLGRQIITLLSSIVFVHGLSAAKIVAREFPRVEKKLVIVDHGNWVGYYKNNSTMKSAREKIEISPDRFLYLFIGFVKEYKNIQFLIKTFKNISGDTSLLIAGKFQDIDYYKKAIELIGGQEKNVRIDAKYIPDDELQYYLNACNVVVLPYAEILTSGAAMLAISFGRPVIAPRQGYLQDVINGECGILYDPKQLDGLLSAMKAAQKRNFDKEGIIKHALCFDWDKIAENVLNAIQ